MSGELVEPDIKKVMKKLAGLAETAECREVVCSEAEETIFLKTVLKSFCPIFILYLISILVTVAAAYLLMIYPSHIAHISFLEGIYYAIFLGFVAGSMLFAVCSLLLPKIFKAAILVKRKLRLLSGVSA